MIEILDVLTLQVLTDPDTDTWTDILNQSTTVKITREVLGAETMSAEILDATLDPIVVDTLHGGRKIRAMALNADTGQLEYLFTGKIPRDGVNVTYDLKDPRPDRQTRISLVAYGLAAQIARYHQPYSVATFAEIPKLIQPGLAGFDDIPWDFDGNTDPVPYLLSNGLPDPDPHPLPGPITNPEGTLLGQLIVMRDTFAAYIWIAKDGTIYGISDRTADPYGTGTAPLDETVYSQLGIGSGAAATVNVLTIEITIPAGVNTNDGRAAGTSAGGPMINTFGPYRDQDSIDTFGEIPGTVKVAGVLTREDAQALANEILAANALPQVQVSAVTIPIRTASDITAHKALIDLMAFVEISNTAKGIDQVVRVQSIEHTITSNASRIAKWSTVLGFTSASRVADGSVSPAPSPPSVIVATGVGNGFPTFINTDQITASTNDTDVTLRLTAIPLSGSLHVRHNGIDLEPDEWSLINNVLTVPASAGVTIRAGDEISTAYAYNRTNPPPPPEIMFRDDSYNIDSFTVPAGTADGDYLLAIAILPAAASVSALNGYTNIGESASVTHAAHSGGSYTYRLGLYGRTKPAGSSPVPTLTTTGADTVCIMVAFAGATAAYASAFGTVADDDTADSPAVTPRTDLRVWAAIANSAILTAAGTVLNSTPGVDISALVVADAATAPVTASTDAGKLAGWMTAGVMLQ